MKVVSRRSATLLVGVAAAAVAVAIVASGATARSAQTGSVCVLLPDTKSSVRWEQFDKPAFVNGVQEGGHQGHGRERAERPAEAALAGRAVHLERCQGGHHHVARHRYLDRDPEEVHGRRWQDDRLRPPDRRRHGLRLHRVRRQPGRAHPGSRCPRRHEGEGHVQPERRRRPALGRPDRRERVLVQERQRRHPEPALQGEEGHEGPREVRARVGREERRRRSSSSSSSRRTTRSTAPSRRTTTSPAPWLPR